MALESATATLLREAAEMMDDVRLFERLRKQSASEEARLMATVAAEQRLVVCHLLGALARVSTQITELERKVDQLLEERG